MIRCLSGPDLTVERGNVRFKGNAGEEDMAKEEVIKGSESVACAPPGRD